MEYVYKYENDVGKVVYVGITNNMQRRISEHKNDKLEEIEDPIIYYFPVSTRADAEMLETYLINHYKTGQYYNVSKTKKGIFTFLDVCDLLPWAKWNGECNAEEKPFVFSSLLSKENIREVVVEKNVYVDTSRYSISNADKAVDSIIQLQKRIKERTEYEESIIDELQKRKKMYPQDEIIATGLKLHLKSRKALRIWMEFYKRYDMIFSLTFVEKQKMLEKLWVIQENNVRRFENKLAERNGRPGDRLPLIDEWLYA